MKKFLLFFLTSAFSVFAFGSDNGEAEETGPWTYKGFFSQQLNQVNMKINPYLTASVMLHMVYDHDIPVPAYEMIGVE